MYKSSCTLPNTANTVRIMCMLGYPKVLVSWQLFRVPPPGELRVPTGVIANDSIGVRMLNEVQLPEQLKARRLQGHFSCDSELMNARVQQVLATSRRSIVGHDNHVADSRPRVALRVRDDVQQFANCRVVLMQGDPASKSRGINVLDPYRNPLLLPQLQHGINVLEREKLYLLPVQGSDTQRYKLGRTSPYLYFFRIRLPPRVT